MQRAGALLGAFLGALPSGPFGSGRLGERLVEGGHRERTEPSVVPLDAFDGVPQQLALGQLAAADQVRLGVTVQLAQTLRGGHAVTLQLD